MNLRDSMLQNCAKWFFLDTGPGSGRFNMDSDNYYLEKVADSILDRPLFRTYGWIEKTVSIGRSQIKIDLNEYKKYPYVCRLTGGQAVLHGEIEDEITYSVVLYHGSKFKELYYEFGNALIQFLKNYDLNASFGYSEQSYCNDFDCFNSKTQADIVVNTFKVIGSAQYRKEGCILQHGSIKLDLLRKLSNESISYSDAKSKLKKSVGKYFGIEFIDYPYFQVDCEKIKTGNLMLAL